MVSFAVGVTVLPVVRAAAERWQLYDPYGPLKIHTRPISRLGGLATLLALLAGTWVAGQQSLQALYSAAMLVWIIGILDDVRAVSPGLRLLVQAAAATLLWVSGLRIVSLPGFLGFIAVVFFVLLVVNAFNMLDGADGLAAGVAAVIAAGYIFLTASAGTAVSAVLGWSLLGWCLSFLMFNFPPASIFMGDSGSTVLGLVIAYLGLDFSCRSKTPGNHLLVAVLFAGVPLLDAILAVLRRVRGSASPFQGDRRHFYDLLLERGWSPAQVALCSYAVTGVLVGVGLFCDQAPWTISAPVLTVLIGSLLLAAVRLGTLRSDSAPRDSGPDRTMAARGQL